MSRREAHTAMMVSLPLSAALLGAAVLVSFSGRMDSDEEAYQQIDLFTRTLSLIEDEYVVEIGMYDAATMERLPVRDAEGIHQGDRILLDPVHVTR